MTIYRYNTVVDECSERTQVISAHKRPDGEVHYETLKTGWWLTLQNDMGGHITWPLGTEKPEPFFAKGSKVIITVALSDIQ